MIVLPPGAFLREGQVVQITHRFALAETEVTQEHYQRVMGQNPSGFSGGGDLPVENVSWLDAVAYCNRLSKMENREPCYDIQGQTVTWPKGLDCPGYRLPTEAEWEYAARADQKTEYAGSDQLDEVGWYLDNSQRRTQLVASKKPNAWGLYDLSGNVWEWTWDWYASYQKGPISDPMGPDKGQGRVLCGGAWSGIAVFARVAYRGFDHPGDRNRDIGFRVARSLPSSL